MKRAATKTFVSRIGLVILLVCGTLLVSAVGCDADVQTALVTGMNTAANNAASALINAAFLTITPDQVDDTTTGTTTTVDTTVPAV